MRYKTLRIMAAVLVLGLLAGCGGAKPQDAYNKQPNVPASPEAVGSLKIGQMATIDGLPFWVAESKDYYRQQGVNVELVSFKSAAERDAALASGQIDGTLTDIMGAVTLHDNGTPVQITSVNLGATIEEGPFAIVSAPGSGITTAEQLKGVEIGIATNTIIHYVTEKLLLENGFAPEEIKTISIPQIPLRFESLMNGTIQAATLPEPLLSLAVHKGGTVVLTDAKAKRNYSQSVIVFRDEVVKEKAEAIKRFFVAYNMAVIDIKQDPEAFKELMATKANLPPEIKDSWQVITFSPAQAPGKAEVEEVVEWLLEKGYIKERVSYDEIVNTTLYPQAR
ncbi:NitT/TauT family transport system substrate-binding protein [Symbiobacterium terraclitae]|uniref:NitT/TauT family transport system substrate-binding protein n=1 Tax=Symbiobacterium terraclitae TaxID=557451 RepID=A0ABS4JSV3_9FIRM|nr:MetQ/NlpA family ABC transporter substrate-binding protein [Symbiobacterium terraclitae]MBP2018617.1 NitT/TauT family transport system substrate-binding protein [Symbiobacterium terraclitae]